MERSGVVRSGGERRRVWMHAQVIVAARSGLASRHAALARLLRCMLARWMWSAREVMAEARRLVALKKNAAERQQQAER